MKAVGFKTPGAIDRDDALLDITIDKPTTMGRVLMPLTTLAAWEALFERLEVNRPTPEGGNLILVPTAARASGMGQPL